MCACRSWRLLSRRRLKVQIDGYQSSWSRDPPLGRRGAFSRVRSHLGGAQGWARGAGWSLLARYVRRVGTRMRDTAGSPTGSRHRRPAGPRRRRPAAGHVRRGHAPASGQVRAWVPGSRRPRGSGARRGRRRGGSREGQARRRDGGDGRAADFGRRRAPSARTPACRQYGERARR